jgi:hypothetical protein
MNQIMNAVLEAAATGVIFAGTVFAIWIVSYCATDIETDSFDEMKRAERFALKLSAVAGVTTTVMRLLAHIWDAS